MEQLSTQVSQFFSKYLYIEFVYLGRTILGCSINKLEKLTE